MLTSSESEDLPSSTKRGKSRRHSSKAKRKTGKKAKTGRERQSKGKSRREGKDGEPLRRGKLMENSLLQAAIHEEQAGPCRVETSASGEASSQG